MDRGSPDVLGLPVPEHFPGLLEWITRVRTGLDEADARYPFVLYGTDWLAFAHLVIAVAFYGPFRDPVRNIWVIEFGMIACAGIIPLALICGPIRDIPFWWSIIDMSFGVIGVIPLLIVHRKIKRLEAMERVPAAGAGGRLTRPRYGAGSPAPVTVDQLAEHVDPVGGDGVHAPVEQPATSCGRCRRSRPRPAARRGGCGPSAPG